MSSPSDSSVRKFRLKQLKDATGLLRYRFEGPGEFKMHELKWLKDKDPNINRIILAFGLYSKKGSCKWGNGNEQKTCKF